MEMNIKLTKTSDQALIISFRQNSRDMKIDKQVHFNYRSGDAKPGTVSLTGYQFSISCF